jgi:hypothetical protein
MKEVIRRGIFETNSSSVHSITMCSDDEYSKWKNGEVYYSRWEHKFISKSEEIEREREETGTDTDYLTYEEFNDWEYLEYEIFDNEYTTESGETVHAFGYYGYDY